MHEKELSFIALHGPKLVTACELHNLADPASKIDPQLVSRIDPDAFHLVARVTSLGGPLWCAEVWTLVSNTSEEGEQLPSSYEVLRLVLETSQLREFYELATHLRSEKIKLGKK